MPWALLLRVPWVGDPGKSLKKVSVSGPPGDVLAVKVRSFWLPPPQSESLRELRGPGPQACSTRPQPCVRATRQSPEPPNPTGRPPLPFNKKPCSRC